MNMKDRILEQMRAKVTRLVTAYRRAALADPGSRATMSAYLALKRQVAETCAYRGPGQE